MNAVKRGSENAEIKQQKTQKWTHGHIRRRWPFRRRALWAVRTHVTAAEAAEPVSNTVPDPTGVHVRSSRRYRRPCSRKSSAIAASRRFSRVFVLNFVFHKGSWVWKFGRVISGFTSAAPCLDVFIVV